MISFSNSPIMQAIAAAVNWFMRVNENFQSVGAAALYGVDPTTTTGLTLGYLGGQFNANTVAPGTLTLTASSTNYVVALRSTGAVSVSTSTTNWTNTSSYLQLYQIVTSATAITGGSDFRQAYGGTGSGSGMSNPMTAVGDIIVGGTSGTPTRLAVGTNGYVLTLASGVPVWSAASGGGFTNPMTASGDLIYGGSSGAATRLAAGTNGQVLTLASGVPTWATAGGGSFTGGTLSSALNEAPTVTIASSSTPAIGAAAGNTISLTGTTTVTGFDTIAAGAIRRVIFAGALTLTYNATSMILPTAANITTAAGDSAVFISLGSGQWRCVEYQRASGAALVSSGGGLSNATETLNTAAPNATYNVESLSVFGSSAQISWALVPKGVGQFLLAIPDNTATGGNVRGNYAVDLQLVRSSASQVASGANSFAAGQSNTAAGGTSIALGNTNATSGSGDVALGNNNTTSSTSVSIGQSNTTSAANSVALGQSNTVSGSAGAAAIGFSNTVDAIGASALGSWIGTRGIKGLVGFGASGRGLNNPGQAQGELFALWTASSGTTTATLATDGSGSISAANQITLTNAGLLAVQGTIIGQSTTAVCAGWTFSALIKRGANAAATAIVGTPTITSLGADSGASTWTVAITADTTNGCLKIAATGSSGLTVYWEVAAVASFVRTA